MTYSKTILTFLILLSGAAYADQTTGGGDQNRPKPPEMTAAQKACFTANGLTAPGDGEPPSTRPDPAVMDKVDACLTANGLTPHHGGPHRGGGHRGPLPTGGGSNDSSDS